MTASGGTTLTKTSRVVGAAGGAGASAVMADESDGDGAAPAAASPVADVEGGTPPTCTRETGACASTANARAPISVTPTTASVYVGQRFGATGRCEAAAGKPGRK